MELLLIIILVLLLFGGGYTWHNRSYYGNGPMSLVGVLLAVILIVLLFRYI